jgi:hypothetical protein
MNHALSNMGLHGLEGPIIESCSFVVYYKLCYNVMLVKRLKFPEIISYEIVRRG